MLRNQSGKACKGRDICVPDTLDEEILGLEH